MRESSATDCGPPGSRYTAAATRRTSGSARRRESRRGISSTSSSMRRTSWERPGRASAPPPRAHGGADGGWINDATKPMLLALGPRQAADLALAIAEAADRAAASLSDDLVSRLATAGNPVNLLRAEHRREHLDEIEH